MELREVLGLGPGTLAAFTGGGGKTSLILRLVQECSAAGLRTLCTTTTRMFPPALDLVQVSSPGDLERARAPLDGGRPACVHGGLGPDGKLIGLDPGWPARLLAWADVVLVEADGSRGLPLKCPAAHEPVIPAGAHLVVPVAGAGALGRPLDGAKVHRPDLAARLLGAPAGAPISPAMVARLLLDPEGCTRGAPPGARVVPVVSQADADLAGARAVAAALLALGAARVVLAAPRTPAPVRAVLAGPA